MYSLLDTELHFVANGASERLRQRFGLKLPKIEEAFSSKISWRPTLHWKTNTHYIVCEISNSPFPISLMSFFSEITVEGLPVKIFIAYPEENDLTLKEFKAQTLKAKTYGIGLVSVENNGDATIENQGISIPLHLAKQDLSSFRKVLKPSIEGACATYMNGDAKHAVQELGQIIECAIRSLAIQAKKKGTLSIGGDPSSSSYSQGNIIDDLMSKRIISNAILGRCRGFVDARNEVSHKPRTKKKAIEQEKKLKENFLTGLSILKDLPSKISEKNYRFKI